jgi:gamma-glutamyl-gamma-aminobutyraldehyde dehydrogenase
MKTYAHWRQRAADLVPRTRLFIGGAWQDPAGDQWFPTVNPATGKTTAHVAGGGGGAGGRGGGGGGGGWVV